VQERNDDPGQKRRGHRYLAHPFNHTIPIDFRDRRSVNYLDHSHTRTWTVYDGKNPYADFSGSGTPLERYVFGPGLLNGAAVDQILARIPSGSSTPTWYLTDRLGTVRDIVSGQGTELDHIVYDSFGSVVTETNATNGDRFKYAGQEYDATTGMYFDRARYYEAVTGRFMSLDPLGFAAGDANLFRYVGNDTTNGVDPSGLQQFTPTGSASSLLFYPRGANRTPPNSSPADQFPGGQLPGGAPTGAPPPPPGVS
jgi:RHS repeat-associated protein